MTLIRKVLLASIPAIALGVAACGGEETKTPAVSAPPAETPAVVEDDADTGADEAAVSVADQIEARQKGFKAIGKNFKVILDNMKAGDAASEDALKSITLVRKIGKKVPDWFPEGTGPESGVKTEAKAEIWTNRADFDAKIVAFQEAVAILSAAGKAADGAAISAAFGEVGKTCKSCHDTYREED